MNVKITLGLKNAKAPTYATDGSGCFDFYSRREATINSHTPCLFDTGVAVEVPEGYVMLIFSRSGHGFNHLTRLANCVGVIDSDYRGTIAVKLINDGGPPFTLPAGSRIAQGLILPLPRIAFQVVSGLGDTVRGEGGFGSTGS
jgi:dUTP pyrophosphatase